MSVFLFAHSAQCLHGEVKCFNQRVHFGVPAEGKAYAFTFDVACPDALAGYRFHASVRKRLGLEGQTHVRRCEVLEFNDGSASVAGVSSAVAGGSGTDFEDIAVRDFFRLYWDDDVVDCYCRFHISKFKTRSLSASAARRKLITLNPNINEKTVLMAM